MTHRIAPNEIWHVNRLDRPQEWQVRLNGTGLRDWQQSNLAGSMSTEDMYKLTAPLNAYHQAIGARNFPGVEEVGGGTVPRYDLTVRRQSPFEHIRNLKAKMPDTPMMALVRSNAGSAMEDIPKDVLEAYILQSADAGIDVFRNFHANNDPRQFDNVYHAVRKAGKHFQAAYSWAVCEEFPTLFNPMTAVNFFKKLQARGIDPDSLVIKDPAGVLTPEMAKFLTQEVKKAFPDKPFGIHTHNQTGEAPEVCLAAIKAGADFVDGAPEPGGYGAQPPMLPLFEAINKWRPGCVAGDVHSLKKADAAARGIIDKYPAHERQNEPDPDVRRHGIAGGQSSIARSEMQKYGVLHRLDELKATIPEIRKEVGFICQVTPAADYILREAIRRMTNPGGKDNDFYCGCVRMLTGQLGPMREPMNEEKQKQALRQRTTEKIKALKAERFFDGNAIDHLANTLWLLSEPVRIRARMRILEERLGELHSIRENPELLAVVNAAIARANASPNRKAKGNDVDGVIAVLEAEREELRQRGARLENGISDETYEALQKESVDGILSQRNGDLYRFYTHILRLNPALQNITPEQGLKLIRAAGFTTICTADTLPPGLDAAAAQLEKLYEKGDYAYPPSARAQLEDRIILGMLGDNRGATHNAGKDIAAQYFAARHGRAAFHVSPAAGKKLELSGLTRALSETLGNASDSLGVGYKDSGYIIAGNGQNLMTDIALRKGIEEAVKSAGGVIVSRARPPSAPEAGAAARPSR